MTQVLLIIKRKYFLPDHFQLFCECTRYYNYTKHKEKKKKCNANNDKMNVSKIRKCLCDV